MTTSALVDLEMDQGSDWAVQIYWTTTGNQPYSIQSPMRMEIRNRVGGVVAVLQTNQFSGDNVEDDPDQSIIYNSASGLIQLQLTAAETEAMGSGQFDYDLFVSYLDSAVTGRVRTKRLISGHVLVNGRITQNV
jgi:hypothetical protein